jgi:hypothetical protein
VKRAGKITVGAAEIWSFDEISEFPNKTGFWLHFSYTSIKPFRINGAGEGNRTLVTGIMVFSGAKWPKSLDFLIGVQ